MRKLRYRFARWLVGPFVQVPQKQGVFVVSVLDDAARAYTVIEADKFRLKTGFRFHEPERADRTFGTYAGLEMVGAGRRWGRFAGTVAFR